MSGKIKSPPLSILLIEDDAFQRQMASCLLAPLGYEVHACESAEDALARLPRIAHLGAILSDIELPGMSGIEFGRCVRGKYPDVLLFAMSSEQDYRASALEAGFNAFVEKPIRLARLAKILPGV